MAMRVNDGVEPIKTPTGMGRGGSRPKPPKAVARAPALRRRGRARSCKSETTLDSQDSRSWGVRSTPGTSDALHPVTWSRERSAAKIIGGSAKVSPGWDPYKTDYSRARPAHPFTTWPDLPETSELPGDFAELTAAPPGCSGLLGGRLPKSTTAR